MTIPLTAIITQLKPFNGEFVQSTAGSVQLIQNIHQSSMTSRALTHPGIRQIYELHDGLFTVQQHWNSQLSTVICTPHIVNFTHRCK